MAVCWIVTFLLYFIVRTSLGLLVGLVAAVATSLWRYHDVKAISRRSFLHGYHAGHHEAAGGVCPYPGPCDVLPLARDRSERIDG